MILNKLIKLAKIKGNFKIDNSQLILKKVFDEIVDILKRNVRKKHTQVEVLYLLIALKELGREYRLSESELKNYFDIKSEEGKEKKDLNYFSIVILLFYIEDKKRYSQLKDCVKTLVREKIEVVNPRNRRKSTELILLLLDMLSCPHLDEAYKLDLLKMFGCDSSVGTELLKLNNEWFIQWGNFDFGKSLEAKRSQEVY